MAVNQLERCEWARSEPNVSYHDQEWGVPLHNEVRLFEMLILEGAQAGLSWTTILKKREGYRLAYRGFHPEPVAAFDQADVNRLLADASIVRNRAKIAASILNARAVLEIRSEFGSLDRFLWSFVNGSPIQNAWTNFGQVPTKTEISDRLSQALLGRGMKFVGSTICYALMQATGMVNDHLVTCPQYEIVKNLGASEA